MGLGIAALGLLMMLGVPLGRLPGDFYVRRGSFSFYFPLTTSIILSIMLTLVSGAFFRRLTPMSIKPDTWITRMAREHQMIEPFVDDQVRAGVISYGVSSYGYDVRVGDEFKVFTNIYNTVVDPKNFDPKSFVDIKARRLHHPAELVRAGEHDRVLPDPARRPDRLPRQVHLRPLRHHRQRHAVRARVGRARHDRDLEHDAAAREDLRQRGHRAGAVLPERRAVRASRTRTRRASTRRSAA